MKTIKEIMDQEFPSSFTILQILKENERGTVALVKRNEDGRECAASLFRGNAAAIRTLQQIHCRNLPEIYMFLEMSDALLLIMEYIPGSTLFDRISERLLTSKEAERISLQLCDALIRLHDAGLVHYDIKPENVILDGDRAVLIDFDSLAPAGEGGSHSGTKGYAPPEQYSGSPDGRAADLYALGVLINTMLTGTHPSKELAPGKWGRIVEKCTMMSPEKRYGSARELKNVIHGTRRKAGLAAAAVLLLLAIGLCVFFKMRPRTYEGGATVDYPWNGGTVTLLLSFDDSSAMDGHFTEELTDRLVPEMESLIYSRLLAWQDGSTAVQNSFAEEIESLAVETIPEEGAKQMACGDPVFSDGTEGMPLAYSDVHYTSEDGTNEILWTVTMKNGDRIRLRHRFSCLEMPVLDFHYEDTPLETMDDINKLIEDVKAQYDNSALVHLYLPPVTYEGTLRIQDLSLSLTGSGEGDKQTTFTDTISVNTRNPALAELTHLRFMGDGGTALLAHEAVVVEDCTFSGWDVAADAEDGSWIILEDCTFSGNKTAFRFNSTMATASADVFERLIFTENKTAVELLRVPGDMTLSFNDCIFEGNQQDFADEKGLAKRNG